MFIHTGLIMEAETPEELKGVIGHEIGHIALGHSVTREAAYASSGNVSLITMGLGALALFAGAPDAALALFGSAPQFQMLSIFKHTRSEEAASDLFGVDLMEKTGQSADGNISFMEKFRYQELMSESPPRPILPRRTRHRATASAPSPSARRRSSAKARPQTPEEIDAAGDDEGQTGRLHRPAQPRARRAIRRPTRRCRPSMRAPSPPIVRSTSRRALTMTEELIAAAAEQPLLPRTERPDPVRERPVAGIGRAAPQVG